MNKRLILENIGAIRGYQKKIENCLNKIYIDILKEDDK